MRNYGGALFVGAVLAITGCAGSDGAQGPQGPKGDTGSVGPTGINGVAGAKLSLKIDGVVTAPVNGVNTATLTFTIYPAANVCPGGTCDDGLSNAVIGQKTFYAQLYNPATRTFDTSTTTTSNDKNFSFSNIHFKGITADGKGAQYTATRANPGFTVETSPNAYVFAYVTGLAVTPQNGNYYLPASVASASKVYGTIGYTSTANVAGCEKCHGAPYSKHGYRQATVAGLPDFVSCKVCHTDQRVGNDRAWYLIADDPAALLQDPKLAVTALRTKYDYTANLMNDVHNSHAFEFNYPQSMANCVTCHAGKLGNVLTDANFRPMVCKSCHPYKAAAGVEGERAPAMYQIWSDAGVLGSHQAANLDPWYAITADNACNACHSAGNVSGAPTFAQLHAGYNTQIYPDAASANTTTPTKFSKTRKATITSASYDAPSYVATVAFSVSGIPSNAVVVPTVVASLYGYDSKDFVISGHTSSPKMECVGVDAACPAPLKTTAGASPNTWTVTINLSNWQGLLQGGVVKRIEVGVLPTIAVDPTQAVSTTIDNKAAVVSGATATLDVTATSADPINAASTSYAATTAKQIVSVAKCNACHDALGTTFHNPNYGSGSWTACRLCHFVGSGASHLEMQSRSIDSFVHAIHQMQEFDVKLWPYGTFNAGTDPANAVSVMRYNDHVEGNFPNFAGPLNCEACHNPGTYDVPDQKKSLPGVLSASGNFIGSPARAVPVEASVVVGPAARACGACHRAQAINEDDGSKLAAFYGHMSDFSSFVSIGTDALYASTTTSANVQYLVGALRTNPGTVAGAKAERCEICHATAGSDHQALFNTWRNGTKP